MYGAPYIGLSILGDFYIGDPLHIEVAVYKGTSIYGYPYICIYGGTLLYTGTSIWGTPEKGEVLCVGARLYGGIQEYPYQGNSI